MMADDVKRTPGTSPHPSLYLEHIQMERFGKFSQRAIGSFQPGLNVVYGPNEAGKSTSVACAKQVLFGWERSNNAAHNNDYQPRGKQQRAASLFFADAEGGEWELSRSGAKEEVLTHHGQSWPDAFAEIRGGISKETYDSVFAFDADRLLSLERTQEGITSKLLTAGSGTHEAPVIVRDHIDDEIRRLSSTRADVPEALGTLRDTINTLQAKIRILSLDADELVDERLEYVGIEAGEEPFQKELDATRAQAYQIRHDIDTAVRTREERAKLRERIDTMRQNYLDKEHELTASRLSEDEEGLLDHADEIDAAYSSLANLRSGIDRLKERRDEIEAAQAELDAMRSTGCRTDPTVKAVLLQRQTKLAGLQSACANTLDNLHGIEERIAGFEARNEADASEDGFGAARGAASKDSARKTGFGTGATGTGASTGQDAVDAKVGSGSKSGAKVGSGSKSDTKVGSGSESDAKSAPRAGMAQRNITLIVLGVLALIGGGVAVGVGYATNTLTASIIAMAVGLAVLGVVLILMGAAQSGRGKEDEARIAARETETRIQKGSLIEEMGRLRKAHENAEQELDNFERETRAFLHEMFMDDADGNIDVALQMYDDENAILRKSTEIAARKIMLQKKAAELDLLISGIKENLAYAPRAAQMSADELLEGIPRVHDHVTALRKRKDISEQCIRELKSITDSGDQLQATKAEQDDSDAALVERYGLDADGDLLIQLRALAEKSEDKVAKLEAQQRSTNARKGELKSLLDTGAASDELSTLRGKLASALGQQRRTASALADLVLARELMTRAIGRWERDRQPAVYQLASAIFSQMTSGAWSSVSFDGSKLLAIDGTSHEFEPEKLSCGTRQQMYLSLRIALLLTASDVGVRLPVIADDILINFDSRRREGAARALALLARKRQVIVFTCHKETQELLKKVDTSANSFDIAP